MENIIKDKTMNFALRIVKLYKFIQDDMHEYIISKQLLRSGTSIGSMVREAEHAESKQDFVHKMAIAQKEANETDYWLELLFKSDYVTESKSLVIDSGECPTETKIKDGMKGEIITKIKRSDDSVVYSIFATAN